MTLGRLRLRQRTRVPGGLEISSQRQKQPVNRGRVEASLYHPGGSLEPSDQHSLQPGMCASWLKILQGGRESQPGPGLSWKPREEAQCPPLHAGLAPGEESYVYGPTSRNQVVRAPAHRAGSCL